MRIECTRRIQFCAGHRVFGHESKCSHLHGHNYVVEITAEADTLDTIGRVVDFSVIKERVGGWIEENWDHGFLVAQKDTFLVEFLRTLSVRPGVMQKMSVLPHNTTAENIGQVLLDLCVGLMEGTGVRITRVVVHETENCKVSVNSD